MPSKLKTFTIGILAAAMLTTGISLPSAEAQNSSQRGLVNVAVFDVIDDVTIVVRDVYVDVGLGVAANILANVCGVAVPVAVLGAAGAAGVFECRNEAGDAGAIIEQ